MKFDLNSLSKSSILTFSIININLEQCDLNLKIMACCFLYKNNDESWYEKAVLLIHSRVKVKSDNDDNPMQI